MPTIIKRNPLKYYLDLKYPVTLIPDITGGYAIEISDLPGCYSQGDTLQEALDNIEEARRLWLESAYEDEIDIPLPGMQSEFSGKFNVRVPKTLHRILTQMAEKEGVSLNQYLVFTLSQALGQGESRLTRPGKRVRINKLKS